MEIPAATAAARRLRAALRPPRQAAGDDRLGRRPRPVEAGARGRQALRPRRRRRRLRDLRLARPRSWRCRSSSVPHARCVVLIEACEESGSYDLPAYVDHLADAHRQAVARGVPRLRLRQLRPAVVHDVAARPGRRQPHGQGAERRRALRRRHRHRAVELPHPAPAARRASRTRTPARSCSTGCTSKIPAERLAQAQRSGEGARQRGLRQVPVRCPA